MIIDVSSTEVVRVYQLPEWINTQAKKNKRKAFRFEFWSMTLIAVTAWLGAAADTQGLDPLWHLGVAALSLAFNLGAFVVEYAVIVATLTGLNNANHATSLDRERSQADALAHLSREKAEAAGDQLGVGAGAPHGAHQRLGANKN